MAIRWNKYLPHWVQYEVDSVFGTPILDKNGKQKFKFRLDDESLKAKIESLWDGHMDIQIVKNKDVGNYLTKEMGKASHIENALRRAEKNWMSPNGERHDKKLIKHDMKKLYGVFYASILHIRMITTSRNLPAVVVEEGEKPPCDLIRDKNNPTVVETLPIPDGFKVLFAFSPYTGAVDPESELYAALQRLRQRPPPSTETANVLSLIFNTSTENLIRRNA
jgi:hypothetical protein